MLRYTDLHIRKSLLPPLEAHLAKEECRITSRNLHCFHAGDGRQAFEEATFNTVSVLHLLFKQQEHFKIIL